MEEQIKTPETLHEANRLLIKINNTLKIQGIEVAKARQRKSNAKRFLKLANAKAIEESRQKKDIYTSDESRKAYAVLKTEKELEELSAAELDYAIKVDERDRLEGFQKDLREASYNLRTEVKSGLIQSEH